MNANGSHCTNKPSSLGNMDRFFKISVISCCVLLCGASRAAAQTYGIVERRNFWNGGGNVNGLLADSLSVSYAEIAGSFESGGYRDVSSSDYQWGAAARTATITHLEKFSLIGKFSFSDTESYGACGSMSARPGHYPIEAYEFTPGRKTRQIYSMTGGIAVPLKGGWSVGGKMDFESQNYTKRKDIRHTDYLLDFSFAPALRWQGDGLSAGISYIFSKNSETVTAEELGITSGVYYAFLDKGLMYGVYDLWDNSSVHLKESGVNGLPIKEITNGGALQFQWGKFYADAEFAGHHGESGEKQKVYNNFRGWSARGRLNWRSGRHYVRRWWNFRTQDNYENILESVTENGVTNTVKYGSNKILIRQNFSTGLEWEMLTSDWGYWRAGAEWIQTRCVSSMAFPYIATRRTDAVRVYAAFLLKFGPVDWRMGAELSKGWIDENRRTAEASVEAVDEPFRLEDWNGWLTDYQKKAKGTVDLSLRYNFSFGLYVDAGFRIVSGFRKNVSSHFGGARCTEVLSVGYDF